MYAFQDWASTPEGDWYLWKQNRVTSWWLAFPRESESGRFALHQEAKTVWKTYCDHTFGGQIWFDVLNQVGGCPAEFVDAVNFVTNQWLQVAGSGKGGLRFTPRLIPADASTLREKTMQVITFCLM